MATLHVRVVTHLTQDELSQLSNLLVAVVEGGASVGFLPPLSRDEARAYWASVPGPGVVLLVAERDGRVVGTAQLQCALQANAAHRAEVAKVLVRPDNRRQGIGRIMMREIEAIARSEGRTLLVLDTRDGDAANDFYRSLGYLAAGRIPRYARSASGQLDATVIYYKELEDGNSEDTEAFGPRRTRKGTKGAKTGGIILEMDGMASPPRPLDSVAGEGEDEFPLPSHGRGLG